MKAGAVPELVSVIVPIFNGEGGIVPLLDALCAQDYPANSLEILIVDNGSTDSTINLVSDYARTRSGPTIRLVLEHEKRGSYAARNKGVIVARGSILAFTDGDCEPLRHWVSAGVEALVRTGAEQVAGAIHFQFAAERPNIWEHLDSVMHLRQDLYVRDNAFGATANLFVRASALSSVGGFRDQLQSGGDFDFGQRMKAAGHKIVFSPEAAILHEARASHGEVATKVRRVAKGLATLAEEGRLRRVSWRDLKPRRRPPEGTPRTSLGRYIALVILINYFHYMRLTTRFQTRSGAADRCYGAVRS